MENNGQFKNVKYGILAAMVAIMFGGSLGLSFGCCEDDIKGFLKSQAVSVAQEQYAGDQDKIDKVVKKSWVYIKRAHLHSQTMGVIAIVFSLLAVFFNFDKLIQIWVSVMGGLGSLGYGLFWLLAALRAPSMGGTHQAKEAVGLLAQVSGASFYLAGMTVFLMLVYKIFITKKED